MSLVEIEFREDRFTRLLWFLVSSAPIPAPTLPSLGADRLIAGLRWGPVELVPVVAGFGLGGGGLFARAQLRVRHVSLAELEASATTVRTETELTAWLFVSAEPDLVVIDLIGLEPAGGSIQFFPPIRIARRRIDTGPMLWPVAGALVQRDDVVTLRFATAAGDNLGLTPVNRLDTSNDTMLVRVSGGIFADQVRQALADATDPPPAGTELEEPASATWMPTSFSGLGVVGEWGAVGNVGVVKPNACPGLFGSVDVSVGITAVLTIVPDRLPIVNAPPPTTASVWLRISGDASDWDTFRCWAGSAGLASVLLGAFVNPFTGIAAGIGSLILMGDYIRSEAMVGVTGGAAPAGFTKVNESGSTVVYRSTLSLSGIANAMKRVTVDGDGLTIVGDLPELVAAAHIVQPAADDHTLPTTWFGHYSCREGHWEESLEVAQLVIRDRITVVGATVGMNLVTVFPTTRVTPPEAWQVIVTPRSVDPVVSVVPRGKPKPGDTGRLYLHSSAGIWRFDIGPVPPIPDRDPTRIMLEAVNCRQFLVEQNPRIRAGWLVDPPPYDFGITPLRQWLLRLPRVPEGTRVSVERLRDEERVDEPVTVVADRTAPLLLELVTDGRTELLIEHTMGRRSAGGRIAQRWLLPLHVVDLPAPATALARIGDHVAVLAGGRVLTVHRGLGEVGDLGVDSIEGLANDGGRLLLRGKREIHVLTAGALVRIDRTSLDRISDRAAMAAAAPYSLTLAGTGMVATAWGARLVIALPFAAASPRWPTGSSR